jgi:hypothetical protein
MVKEQNFFQRLNAKILKGKLKDKIIREMMRITKYFK